MSAQRASETRASETIEISRRSLDYAQHRRALIPGISRPARAIHRNGVLVFEQQDNQPAAWENDVRALAIQCCEQYPSISVDKDVLGGVPHIRGSRVSVDYILDGIYVLGSIKAVARKYSHITETQVRDAVGYAQTFMELASEPYQADD